MSDRLSYAWPIVQALMTQVVVTVFCCGFKDGGYLLEACLIATGFFWASAIVVVLVGPCAFGRTFVRWGLLPVALIGTTLFWPLTGAF